MAAGDTPAASCPRVVAPAYGGGRRPAARAGTPRTRSLHAGRVHLPRVRVDILPTVPDADAIARLTIPADLLPRDGRFGSGPSKVRAAQVDALAAVSGGTPSPVSAPAAPALIVPSAPASIDARSQRIAFGGAAVCVGATLLIALLMAAKRLRRHRPGAGHRVPGD